MSGLFSWSAWSTVWNHRESFLLGLGNTLQTAVCALALAAGWWFTGGDLTALPQLLRETLHADRLPHSGAKLI